MGERIIPSVTNTLKLFFENIVRVRLYQHSQDKQLCTLHRLLRWRLYLVWGSELRNIKKLNTLLTRHIINNYTNN